METWPELSRSPAPKARGTTVDPTLRDNMQNGAEATGLQWPRGRRQWDYTIEYLSPDDAITLETFVRETVGYGARPFLFPDNRDPRNPVNRIVRFSVLPAYSDVQAENENRYNVTFQIREV